MTAVLLKAERIKIDPKSRLIFFSDIHRGDSSWADEFAANQTIYAYALEHYFQEGFTYIEVGDGDKLMKNTSPRNIQRAHLKVYQLLRDYYLQDRFYYIQGNHDIQYKNSEYAALNLTIIHSPSSARPEILFPGIKIHEGLLLEHWAGGSILVTHGHQGELFNDRLWRLSRLLLLYIWRPLQMIGIQNPFRVSHNPEMRREVENQLISRSRDNNQPLLCGHTHCAALPKPGETAYFNTGCCVHPQGITGIEIDQGSIMLIHWRVKPDQQGSLFIQREILAGPENLEDYFPQHGIDLGQTKIQLGIKEESALPLFR